MLPSEEEYRGPGVVRIPTLKKHFHGVELEFCWCRDDNLAFERVPGPSTTRFKLAGIGPAGIALEDLDAAVNAVANFGHSGEQVLDSARSAGRTVAGCEAPVEGSIREVVESLRSGVWAGPGGISTDPNHDMPNVPRPATNEQGNACHSKQ